MLPTPTTRLFPLSLTKVGVMPIQGTQLAYSAAIFVVLAAVCAVVLHATPLGRSLFAIGLQPEAALFSGIRVTRIRFGLYVASGIVCAFAGILFTLKNSSASYGAGIGPGTDRGGDRAVRRGLHLRRPGHRARGGAVGDHRRRLQQALTQMQVQPEVQNIVTGVLLLISVIMPNSGRGAPPDPRANPARSPPSTSPASCRSATDHRSTPARHRPVQHDQQRKEQA